MIMSVNLWKLVMQHIVKGHSLIFTLNSGKVTIKTGAVPLSDFDQCGKIK